MDKFKGKTARPSPFTKGHPWNIQVLNPPHGAFANKP